MGKRDSSGSSGMATCWARFAFFREGAHSATAVALEVVLLLVIPADRLERIVRTNPELAIALIRQLARIAAREDGSAAHDQ